jgi:hypothetical protein
LRSAIAIGLAAVFVASAARAQEDPWGDNARLPEATRESELKPDERKPDDRKPEEQKPEDLSDDDPEAQAEVEKSAAELEAVRKA